MTTQTQDIVDGIDAALKSNVDKSEPPIFKEAKRSKPEPTDQPADIAEDVKPYGLKSFTTRDVPWGQIGRISKTAHSAAEAAELGGLNFEVELLDAGFKLEKQTKPGEPLWRTIPHRRACVRKDTKQFFSFVSATYTPVQYASAFGFMDEIHPLYCAAGTLGGGKQGFMVVKMPDEGRQTIELKFGKLRDPLDLYVVLRTSHDLTRAVEVSVMMLRGKCMNALSLNSFTADAVQRWSVKHVGKDPVKRLHEAEASNERITNYVNSFKNTAKLLHDIKLEMEEADELLKRILPDRPKRGEQVSSIIRAWRESPTNGFPDNGWGLVNAVSEYFEWGRPDGTRTDQSRFTGGLTGQTHKYTNRTAQLLLRRR